MGIRLVSFEADSLASPTSTLSWKVKRIENSTPLLLRSRGERKKKEIKGKALLQMEKGLMDVE